MGDKINYYPPYHVFVCPECDEKKDLKDGEQTEMESKEFIDHLKNVHNIAEPKGQRQLMLHINKRPRHCASYKWIIEEKTFYEYYG